MPGTEIARPFVEVPGPIRRFFHVHVDPLPNSEGDNTHQLMVIDLFRTMRSRDHELVLGEHTIDLRWVEFGMGRGWEGGGQFTSNLGPRWTGSHHAKGGFPSK
jgi:hypothetical protein